MGVFCICLTLMIISLCYQATWMSRGEWLLPLAHRLRRIRGHRMHSVYFMPIFTPLSYHYSYYVCCTSYKRTPNWLLGAFPTKNQKYSKFLNLRFSWIEIQQTNYNAKPINKLLCVVVIVVKENHCIQHSQWHTHIEPKPRRILHSLCSFIICNWMAGKWASPSDKYTQSVCISQC